MPKRGPSSVTASKQTTRGSQNLCAVQTTATLIDNMHVPPTSEEKIEALAEIICRAGDEPSAALLVLMATLENAPHPKALANTAKHFAFTRCVESNLYGMVDAQIAALEAELLAANSLAA